MLQLSIFTIFVSIVGAAITGGPVTVYGCGSESVQGDARFARVLEKMGCDVIYGPNYITLSRDLNVHYTIIDDRCVAQYM